MTDDDTIDDDTIDDETTETDPQPKRNWGGPRVKGQIKPKPDPKPRGGYRPNGGRPAGSYKIGNETIRVASQKGTGKLHKANQAVADAAALIGIQIDPLVALMSPVEIQFMAAKMHASAAMVETDPVEQLRKWAAAAGLANRIADFFDAKMATTQHHTIDRDPNTLSTAEIKAMLMQRAQTDLPMIEGRVVDEDQDEDRGGSSLDHQDGDQD
jgi:hypothetical protein